MPLDEMTVQAGRGEKGALQVNEGAWFPVVEGGFLEGFGYGSDPVAVAGNLFDGEANAVVGYALVYFKLVGEGGGIQKVLLVPWVEISFTSPKASIIPVNMG